MPVAWWRGNKNRRERDDGFCISSYEEDDGGYFIKVYLHGIDSCGPQLYTVFKYGVFKAKSTQQRKCTKKLKHNHTQVHQSPTQNQS